MLPYDSLRLYFCGLLDMVIIPILAFFSSTILSYTPLHRRRHIVIHHICIQLLNYGLSLCIQYRISHMPAGGSSTEYPSAILAGSLPVVGGHSASAAYARGITK